MTWCFIVLGVAKPPSFLYLLDKCPKGFSSLFFGIHEYACTLRYSFYMALKPPASQAPTNATSSVRRNLFHHHLSRRPTGPSTSTSATALQEPLPDSSSDIVIRDINGNYAVQIPLLPPLEDDQVPEDEVSEKESKHIYQSNHI